PRRRVAGSVAFGAARRCVLPLAPLAVHGRAPLRRTRDRVADRPSAWMGRAAVSFAVARSLAHQQRADRRRFESVARVSRLHGTLAARVPRQLWTRGRPAGNAREAGGARARTR